MEPAAYTANEIYDRLSAEQQGLLVSLPYRAGLYISFSDVTGGWDAQEAELQSLTNILRQYAEDFCKSELSQKVLMDCLRERGQWPVWAKDIDLLPKQIDGLLQVMEPMMTPKSLNAFKGVIVDVALAVAMAFREKAGEEETDAEARGGFFQSLRGYLGRADKGGTAPLDHLNISPAERAALSRLCAALRHVL